MALLELERVSKRFGRGLTEHVVLHEVSLRIEIGELVVVWGGRRSGRSTLLRIAAGLARPDQGIVRAEGCDLAGRGGDARREAIGYCLTTRRPREPQLVLEQIVADQLIRGVGIEVAEQCARVVLARVGAEHCATLPLRELDAAEAVRVGIARALSLQPKILVLDEPTLGVEVLVRDEILKLLRSLAKEGIAVLMTTGETRCFSGADHALSLDAGQLHGKPAPELAPVLPLRRSA
jgi:ABC-type multidrug transport system ATPase subunit